MKEMPSNHLGLINLDAQRFAVILDHDLSWGHMGFFRRPTRRKRMLPSSVPFQRATPPAQPHCNPLARLHSGYFLDFSYLETRAVYFGYSLVPASSIEPGRSSLPEHHPA